VLAHVGLGLRRIPREVHAVRIAAPPRYVNGLAAHLEQGRAARLGLPSASIACRRTLQVSGGAARGTTAKCPQHQGAALSARTNGSSAMTVR
jgi:hypothetical protein